MDETEGMGSRDAVRRLPIYQGLADPARHVRYWTTSKGVKYPIASMTDSHLMNIIRIFLPPTRPARPTLRATPNLDAVCVEAVRRALPVPDNVRNAMDRLGLLKTRSGA